MPRPLLLFVATVIVGIGCRAADSVTTAVGDDSWVRLAPAPWQARLAKPDPGAIEDPLPLSVVRLGTETMLASGSRAVGTTTRFVDGDATCELHVDRDFAYDESSAPVGLKHPRSQDLRTRTYRGVVVTARCPGRAVPGTDAAARGSRALWFAPWFALLVALGATAARLAGGNRIGIAIGVTAAGIAAVLGAGLGAIGGRFALTSIIGLAGAFVLGWVAGAASAGRRRVAIAGGLAALLAMLGFALYYSRWSVFGPILATVTAGATMITVLVVGVMLPEPAGPGRRPPRRAR